MEQLSAAGFHLQQGRVHADFFPDSGGRHSSCVSVMVLQLHAWLWRVAGKAKVNVWCRRGLGCSRRGLWVCDVGVEGVCVLRMLLNSCSNWPVARAAQFVFVAVGGVVRTHFPTLAKVALQCTESN